MFPGKVYLCILIMNNYRKILIFALALAAFVSCRELSNTFSDDKLIARVGGASLYMTDVESIFTPGLSEADSVKLLENYIDMWVRKQLKVEAMEKLLNAQDEREIEKMVEDYRSSMLSYRMDRYLMENAQDSVVTDEQIKEYYDAHKGDFLLDRPMIKGRYVAVPDSYRQKAKLKELMVSTDVDKQKDFSDICAKNEFDLRDFSSWTDFAAFVSQLPVSRDKNYDNLLTSRNVQEFKEGNMTYYALVTDVIRAGEVAPLDTDRVRTNIIRILQTQRNMDIIRSYEDSLYNEGLKSKSVFILGGHSDENGKN